MNTLSAEKRDMQIKAKKLRREGFVTGNVFGKNMEGSMPLKIEKKEVSDNTDPSIFSPILVPNVPNAPSVGTSETFCPQIVPKVGVFRPLPTPGT